jgi:hypothetical protein
MKIKKDDVDFCLKVAGILATIAFGFGVIAFSINSDISKIGLDIINTLINVEQHSIDGLLKDALKNLALATMKQIDMSETFISWFYFFFELSLICLALAIIFHIGLKVTKKNEF